MNNLPKLMTAALALLAPLASGCGIEELIMGAIIDEPVVTTPIPGSIPEGAGQIRGQIPGALGEVTLSFYSPLGQLLEGQDVEIDYTKTPVTYSAVILPQDDDVLFNVRVVAESGGVMWKAIVPDPVNGGDSVELDIDAVSTALALALEMKPVPRDGAEDLATPTPTADATATPSPTATEAASPTPGSRLAPQEDAPPALGNFPCDGVDLFYEALTGQILAASGPGYDLFVAVSQAIDSGSTPWPAVIESHSDLSDPLATLAIAAGKSASANGTLLPGTLRVFMGVVRIQKYPDHKCREVDIDKWVNPDAGDSMFLVGGIHEDSPIQDAYIQNEVFPNWVPNILPLFDDGTHGDNIAGDNIWVRSFVLPETLRIGYKYTYGAQGQNWTGTEEWPGNQRLLEIVDVNGDGVVARFDVFADERSNKDKQNLYEPGGTNITWDTDLDGDGYYEAQEMPADFIGGDCLPDGFWQPFSQPPVTQEGCF